jgi:FKBP-type peptidyl-prolyl cis-trans isomerase SlyD
MSDKLTVKDGQVVSMEYTLRVSGDVVDSSEGGAPLDYLHGYDNIVPGLEAELTGMEIGQSKDVSVAPEDAYGEYDEEAFADIPRSQFPAEFPLEVGLELEVEDEDGEPMVATIESIEGDTVTLDFNHPLAGETLDFTIKIVGIRPATKEELEHGHPHGEGHEH